MLKLNYDGKDFLNNENMDLYLKEISISENFVNFELFKNIRNLKILSEEKISLTDSSNNMDLILFTCLQMTKLSSKKSKNFDVQENIKSALNIVCCRLKKLRKFHSFQVFFNILFKYLRLQNSIFITFCNFIFKLYYCPNYKF